MTPTEAKKTLLLYRHGREDAADVEMAQALELARQDPELGRWFEQHCAFQRAVRKQLQSVQPPPGLKERILAEQKIVRPPVPWRAPVWLAAAAVFVLLGVLVGLWLRPAVPDRFADYQARMVRIALREYHMDVETNDMRQVRQLMAAHGAPADYVLTPGLSRVPLAGGGVLRWRNQPVSMVCFDRGARNMLFLFVIERKAVRDPPPPSPQVRNVSKLETASWSQGDKTYLLAGPPEADFPRKYL